MPRMIDWSRVSVSDGERGRITSAASRIRAEVPGVDGDGLEDSVPISGDNLEAEVRWKHGVAVGCRAAESRVLRLHLEEATVYAFEFRRVAQSGPA